MNNLEELLNDLPENGKIGVLVGINEAVNAMNNGGNSVQAMRDSVVNGGLLDGTEVLDDEFMNTISTQFKTLFGNNQTISGIMDMLTPMLAGKSINELPGIMGNIDMSVLSDSLHTDPKYNIDDDIKDLLDKVKVVENKLIDNSIVQDDNDNIANGIIGNGIEHDDDNNTVPEN